MTTDVWPFGAPSPESVERHLLSWAGRTSFARAKDVTGVKRITPQTHVVVVDRRVNEVRTEEWRDFAGPSLPVDSVLSEEPLHALYAPAVTMQERSWFWIRGSTAVTGPCGSCQAGYVPCSSCGGRGQVLTTVQSTSSTPQVQTTQAGYHHGNHYHQPHTHVTEAHRTTTTSQVYVNCRGCGGSGRRVHGRCQGYGLVTKAVVAVVAHAGSEVRRTLRAPVSGFMSDRHLNAIAPLAYNAAPEYLDRFPHDVVQCVSDLHRDAAGERVTSVEIRPIFSVDLGSPERQVTIAGVPGSLTVWSRVRQRRRNKALAAALAAVLTAVVVRVAWADHQDSYGMGRTTGSTTSATSAAGEHHPQSV